MAITTAMCTSFKVGLLGAEFDFSSGTTHVFKMALYTSSADLGAATTAYSVTNEVTGSGYTAGGATVTISVNPTASGTTAYIDFDDVTWAAATITARGCLIYRETSGNPAVAVYDFGENKTSTAANFVVQIPTAGASTAVVRIA